MIELYELTKTYGTRAVVDTLSFRARPGTVTGFLGSDGAGKSTTMRMSLGLDQVTGASRNAPLVDRLTAYMAWSAAATSSSGR